MRRTCSHCLDLIPYGRPAIRVSGGAWFCSAPACRAEAERARRRRIEARCPFTRGKGGAD